MVPHILGDVTRIIRNPHFWLILALFTFSSVLHYACLIVIGDIVDPSFHFGLTRHSLERILFLVPIIYSAYIFKLTGGLVTSFAALLVVLPRATLISPAPADAILETVGVILIGVLVSLWSWTLARAKGKTETALARLNSAQDNLRYYLQEITRAQEKERKRIARELHDDTAQDLVVLSHQLDSFVTSATDHLSVEDISCVEGLRQQTERILDGVHRFSQDLRPSVLDDLGLVPALEWLTSDLTNHFEIAIALEVRGSEHRFPPETELILFRIAQEALRNMWKHSKASKAWVTVEFGDGKIILTVKDNGKGFELPGKMEDLAVEGKLGLAGMQERAQLIGGRLTVQSESGKGTTVIVQAPVNS